MLLFSLLSILTQKPLEVTLPAGPSPVTNPLKGYAPYVDSSLGKFPMTMTFYETSWRELEPKEGDYRFADWEAKTFKTGFSKDKRVVLRVFMDYPNQPIALPQWLIDAGVKMTPYNDEGIGKGLSPDYSDPRLRAALKKFIAAAGARWNKDPQVAFVQLGILGHWGEWHTWPRTELFAPDAVQREVIDQMHAVFPNKQLMGRNAVDYPGKQAWLGFHDDMIPQDTVGPDEWMFLPTMKTAGRDQNWKVAPTGGEMVPGAAAQYLGKDWDLTLRAVNEAHLSWIGPYSPPMYDGKDPNYQARMTELSQKLGYDFRLDRVKAIPVNGKIAVHLEGVNQGVAPFYYAWPARFALLDASGAVVASADSNADIRKWLPGSFSLDASLPKPNKPGNYRLAFGLIDPWSHTPTVQFANRLPVMNGWTILAPLTQ